MALGGLWLMSNNMFLHTTTDHVRLACGNVMDWRDVIEPNSVKLSHVDGPYDMRKADWDCLTGARVEFNDQLELIAKTYPDIPTDRINALGQYIAALTVLDPRGADLAAWYAPVLTEVSAASALSASVYLWNTDAGEALLRPVMQVFGWTYRGCLTWLKTGAHPALIGAANAGTWADITERCGVYQRGNAAFCNPNRTSNVWALSPTSGMIHERLYGDEKAPHRVTGRMQQVGAHPCQKPLDFAERIIRASSNPNDLVVDWFAGTSRIAVANVQRLDRSERRDVVSIEMDSRWFDAVAPALCPKASLQVQDMAGQVGLFVTKHK